MTLSKTTDYSLQILARFSFSQDFYPIKRDGDSFAPMGLAAVPDDFSSPDLPVILNELHSLGVQQIKINIFSSL